MNPAIYVDAWDRSLERLSGLGLKRRKFVHKSLFWHIVYVTETTLLEIDVDLREHYQIVEIYPRRTLTGQPDLFNKLYLRCPFHMVLSIRAPGLKLSSDLPVQPDDNVLTKELSDDISAISAALYEYAADILAGDFSIYPKITALREERRRQ